MSESQDMREFLAAIQGLPGVTGQGAGAPNYARTADGEVRLSEAPQRVTETGELVPDQHLGESIEGRELLIPALTEEEVAANTPAWNKPLVRVRIPDGVNPSTFRAVVANAYSMYVLGDRVTVETLTSRTGMLEHRVRFILDSPEFKYAMQVRGCDLSGISSLSPEQDFALQILTDPYDKSPMSKKLKKAGITGTTYRAWLQNKAFAEQMNRMSEMITASSSEALIQLAGKAGEGDLRAIQLLLEVNNRHNPAKEQQQDMWTVLSRILEVVYRNVKDPAIIEAIAQEVHVIAAEVSEVQTVNNLGHKVIGG